MPYRGVLLLAFFAVGCQSAPKHQPVSLYVENPGDEAVSASALVFDPPVIQDEAPLELSRIDRQPSVSVGYEDLTAEYFYIRMEDRQVSDGISGSNGHGGSWGSGSFDRFERRAVTERIGVRYR